MSRLRAIAGNPILHKNNEEFTVRFSLIVGIILIVIAVVVLVIGVQGVDNAFVEEQLTSLLCEPEERLTQVSGRGDRSGERTTTFYCEFSNGERRDVTLGAVAMIGGAFVVPFLLGLLLVITGGIRMAKQRVTDFTQTIMSAIPEEGGASVQTIDLRGGNVPPEAMATLQDVFGRLGVAFSAMGDMNDDDLAGRMEELKEALDKGLITQEEYDRVRQNLLNNFGA